MKRKSEAFASIFYKRYCGHVVRLLLKITLLLLLVGFFASSAVSTYLKTGTFHFVTAFFVATFLVFLWGALGTIQEMLHVRVLPYFSQRLGDAHTFQRGETLLRNSRFLDDLAKKLGVQPLSDFASGDDMIFGEKLRWFDPNPALQTASRLLESPEANTFSQELRNDLEALRDALVSAQAKQIRFCLILREGTMVSGLEMDRRQGSFF